MQINVVLFIKQWAMRLCLQAALPKAVGAEELGLHAAQGTADEEEEEVGARGGGGVAGYDGGQP